MRWQTVEKEQPQREFGRRYEGWGKVHSGSEQTSSRWAASPSGAAKAVLANPLRRYSSDDRESVAIRQRGGPGDCSLRLLAGAADVARKGRFRSSCLHQSCCPGPHASTHCRWWVDGPSQPRDDQEYSEGSSGHYG